MESTKGNEYKLFSSLRLSLMKVNPAVVKRCGKLLRNATENQPDSTFDSDDLSTKNFAIKDNLGAPCTPTSQPALLEPNAWELEKENQCNYLNQIKAHVSECFNID